MSIFVKLFVVFVILVTICPFSVISNESSNTSLPYIHNHQFLFISGWPQSGTSLMQQIFTVAPETSTMVQRCFEMIPGSKCLDWNFEGQWILKFFSGATRSAATVANTLMNPGAMCAMITDYNSNEQEKVPENRITSDSIQTNPPSRQAIVPGNILNITSDEYSHALQNTLSTWRQFWNLDMPLLVEKSPHAMLKTRYLRNVYAGAQSVKFIVVIKVSS